MVGMKTGLEEKKRFPIQTGIINPRFLSRYDFIEAVQEEVKPKDNELVMDVLIDFFKSGRVKFLKFNSETDINFDPSPGFL